MATLASSSRRRSHMCEIDSQVAPVAVAVLSPSTIHVELDETSAVLRYNAAASSLC